MIITQPPLNPTELFLAQNLGVIMLVVAAFCLGTAWAMYVTRGAKQR
jgi:hypothetical protein